VIWLTQLKLRYPGESVACWRGSRFSVLLLLFKFLFCDFHTLCRFGAELRPGPRGTFKKSTFSIHSAMSVEGDDDPLVQLLLIGESSVGKRLLPRVVFICAILSCGNGKIVGCGLLMSGGSISAAFSSHCIFAWSVQMTMKRHRCSCPYRSRGHCSDASSLPMKLRQLLTDFLTHLHPLGRLVWCSKTTEKSIVS
jgi:hypothetical protein